MSGYSMFEANVSSDDESQRQQREAADTLAAATYDVRQRFGSFLFGSRDLEEYRDRLALTKTDILKTIEPHVFPRTGVVRRVLKPLEDEFKSIRTAAMSKTAVGGYAYDPGSEAYAESEQYPGARYDNNGVYMPPPVGGTKSVSTGPGGTQTTTETTPSNAADNIRADNEDDFQDSSSTLPADRTMNNPPMPGSTSGATTVNNTVPSPAAGTSGTGTGGTGGTGTGGTGAAAPGGTGWQENNLTDAINTQTYTAVEGDTLSDNAQRSGWGENYQGLADSAGIADPNVINVGQEYDLGMPKGMEGGNDSRDLSTAGGKWGAPAAQSADAAQAGLDAFGTTPSSAAQATTPASAAQVSGDTTSIPSSTGTTPVTSTSQTPILSDPTGQGVLTARRRRADFESDLDTSVTFSPSDADLEPEGDFYGYLGDVDQGAEGKVDRNFVARFASWCQKNRVAPTLAALDHYNPGDRAYIVIASALQRTAEEGAPQPVDGGLGWAGPGTGGIVDMNSEPAAGSINSPDLPPTYEVRSAGRRRKARRRVAAPDYLQKADEALTNLLNQKAEEFQAGVAPLQQALQTVQMAEQEAQAANPMNVLPPAGTVNVMPGQDPAAGGGMDPNALAAMLGGGGGDPMAGGGGGIPPELAAMLGGGGGGMPPGADQGGGGMPPEMAQQMMAARRRMAYEGRRRQAGDSVQMKNIPECDIHKYEDGEEGVPAAYDGKTKFGPWANMCEKHFKTHGVGLGTGKGQRFTSGRRQAMPSLKEIRIHDKEKNLFSGVDGSGNRVVFKTSPDESKQLRDVMFGDLAQNFSGVSVGDEDIVRQARRRRATEWKKVNNDGYPAGADGGNMTKAERDKYNADEDEKHGLNHDASRRQAQSAEDLWSRWISSPQTTLRGDDSDYESFAKQFGVGQRAVNKLRQSHGGPQKAASRKQAWSGWGNQQSGMRRVAGWDFDHHLNGYITTASASTFPCDCGTEFPTPSGYRRCASCNKSWNSYVIGTDGNGRQASMEKLIVREIPVRDNVIVANKRQGGEYGKRKPVNTLDGADKDEAFSRYLTRLQDKLLRKGKDPDEISAMMADVNTPQDLLRYKNLTVTAADYREARKCTDGEEDDDDEDVSIEHFSRRKQAEIFKITEEGGTPSGKGQDPGTPKGKASYPQDWSRRDKNQRWTR